MLNDYNFYAIRQKDTDKYLHVAMSGHHWFDIQSATKFEKMEALKYAIAEFEMDELLSLEVVMIVISTEVSGVIHK